MAYLTNVKTFLTFIVVTFTFTIQFSMDMADGIGTLNVQLADLSNPSNLENAKFGSFLTGASVCQTPIRGLTSWRMLLLHLLICPKSMGRERLPTSC